MKSLKTLAKRSVTRYPRNRSREQQLPEELQDEINSERDAKYWTNSLPRRFKYIVNPRHHFEIINPIGLEFNGSVICFEILTFPTLAKLNNFTKTEFNCMWPTYNGPSIYSNTINTGNNCFDNWAKRFISVIDHTIKIQTEMFRVGDHFKLTYRFQSSKYEELLRILRSLYPTGRFDTNLYQDFSFPDDSNCEELACKYRIFDDTSYKNILNSATKSKGKYTQLDSDIKHMVQWCKPYKTKRYCPKSSDSSSSSDGTGDSSKSSSEETDDFSSSSSNETDDDFLEPLELDLDDVLEYNDFSASW